MVAEVMFTVIYADTLFFVNFSMDFLALFITASLSHAVVRPWRMTAAALLGALFALAEAIIGGKLAGVLPRLILTAAWILTAIAMTRLAVGGGWRTLLLFAGVNIGLGGLMTALLSLVMRLADSLSIPRPDASPLSSPWLFAAIAIVSGIVSLLWGRAGKKSRRRLDVTVRAFGGEVTLPMLIDSGNLLREPYSGRPVIVVAAARIAPILPAALSSAAPADLASLPPELASGLRLIPTSGVTGARLLIGIQPERVMADGRTLDCMLAIDPAGTDYDGCGGIVPNLDYI